MPDYERVSVRVVDLTLDQKNARLAEEQPSQPATYLALTKLDPRYVLNMAEDIVKNGTDPTSLPAVVAIGDRRKRYLVLEGNRRVLALKALETPSIITPELSSHQQKRLSDLAHKFALDPIDEIDCVLFKNEADARHWIELRHTGLNEGAGLAPWEPEGKDRFRARHGGALNPASQALDFLRRAGVETRPEPRVKGISSQLQRLISSPHVREAIGVRMESQRLLSDYPASETIKGLGYLAEELRTGRLKTGDIYDADARREFATKLPASARPKKSKRLKDPVPLEELPISGGPAPSKKSTTPTRSRRQAAGPGPSIVPKDCPLTPTEPRLNLIYNELYNLPVELYPNACSVLLRVFIELSVDRLIEQASLLSEAEQRNAKLAKKLKVAADHLHSTGKIPKKLRDAIHNVADGNGPLVPSISSYHQYVHNQYAYPKPAELRLAWTEMQPFLVKLGP